MYLSELLKEFYNSHNTSLVTDPKSTFNLPASIREPAEALNKVALATIRVTLPSSLLSSIRWSPGSHHAVDLHTENSHAPASRLINFLHDGIYLRHPSEIECAPENLDNFSS